MTSKGAALIDQPAAPAPRDIGLEDLSGRDPSLHVPDRRFVSLARCQRLEGPRQSVRPGGVRLGLRPIEPGRGAIRRPRGLARVTPATDRLKGPGVVVEGQDRAVAGKHQIGPIGIARQAECFQPVAIFVGDQTDDATLEWRPGVGPRRAGPKQAPQGSEVAVGIGGVDPFDNRRPARQIGPARPWAPGREEEQREIFVRERLEGRQRIAPGQCL